MRDAPEGVRSVVLDSVFPLEVNGIPEAPYPLYWATEQISTNCAADADYATNVGDIKSLIEDGIARLESAPLESFAAIDYVELLINSIAEPQVPQIVNAVATSSDDELRTLLSALQGGSGEQGDREAEISPADVHPFGYPFVADSDGMGYSIVCAEEVPFLESKAGPDIATPPA